MSKQKCSLQNQICLVVPSCAEISYPSEVSWFVGKLIFSFFKEVKLVCVLDNRMLAHTNN